ncbi:MAG: hypothetical protein V4487_08235 [Chlamydiota bacterium]
MLKDLMTFFGWILSLAISNFISVKIALWSQRRARVVCYLGQVGQFRVKDTEIATHSLVIVNKGKVSAKNLQVAHMTLYDFNVNPPGIVWEQRNLDNGLKVIEFPNFVRGQVTISYLYPPESWRNIHGEIKHDDGAVKPINVFPTQVWPKPLLASVWVLLLVGALTTLNIVYHLFLKARDYFTF